MSKIYCITGPDDLLVEELLAVWESSVRVTHTFLSEEDIEGLKPLGRQAVQEIESLYCYNDGELRGFIGIDKDKIEMLFVDDKARGKGVGKKLLLYAIDILGACYVDVNEQNPQARDFYEHMGFRFFARSPVDSQGRSFPLLHMKLGD